MILVISFIAVVAVNNPWSNMYVSTIKEEAITVGKQNDSLYTEIENYASKHLIPASDAKIDPVWKATPGYNGLEVDINESYKKMKKKGIFNESMLVYQQIKPKVHLQDLPPSAIYRGNPDKPMVSLLINVAWGNEYLPSMLATLKKHNVSATFFLEGRWVKENPELAKMITESGHEVGNHSYTHPDMKNLSAAAIKDQIEKTNKVIEATTGVNCVWLAPPSGSYRDEVVQIADTLGLGTIMWSVDTIDWQKPTPETIVNRVLTKVHPGAFILMHPTDSSSKALEQLIQKIKQKKLHFGTVSETLSEERVF
jgi:peptidoglycan-N-acetylglucosamine deacetylase